MATRALYVFKDLDQTFIVYKHWDGYPEGAYEYIINAIPFAWELPRFEASDFSAAFIAGNKKEGGGDIYMTNSDTTNADVMGIEYIYTITGSGKNFVTVKTEHLGYDEKLPDVDIDGSGILKMMEVA